MINIKLPNGCAAALTAENAALREAVEKAHGLFYLMPEVTHEEEWKHYTDGMNVLRAALIDAKLAPLVEEVEDLRVYKEMDDAQMVLRPEPKNPTLWMYLRDSHKNGVIDFHIRIEPEWGGGGGFKFYIHAAQASSSTEDFYIWPDPFSWHDMVANTKDIPEPDIEAFKKSLRKTLAPKEGK